MSINIVSSQLQNFNLLLQVKGWTCSFGINKLPYIFPADIISCRCADLGPVVSLPSSAVKICDSSSDKVHLLNELRAPLLRKKVCDWLRSTWAAMFRTGDGLSLC